MKKGKKNKQYFLILTILIIFMFFSIFIYKQEEYNIPINFIFNDSDIEVTEKCLNASLSINNVICDEKLKIEIINTGYVNLGKIFPIKISQYDDQKIYTTITVLTTKKDVLPNQKSLISTDKIKGNVSYVKIISNECPNAVGELYINLTC